MLWTVIAIIAGLIFAFRIYYHAQSGKCYSKRRLDGKTVIVTGASAGIGKETARDLAQRGAKVILACRNIPKSQRVADDIIATTGNKQVIVRQLDLSNMASVRKFAKGILDTEPGLHILVNNAGILGPRFKTLTDEGLELSMATNHFGHFLLTNMLLNLLKASGPSRIVNVSSESHYLGDIDPDDLNYERKPYPFCVSSYSNTKLCNNLFTVELADRLRDTNVTTNCLSPGCVNTEIFHKHGNMLYNYITLVIFRMIGKNETMGAQTSIYLAVSEDVENISGEYFNDCTIYRTLTKAKDRGLAKRLWEASARLVKLTKEDTEYEGKFQK